MHRADRPPFHASRLRLLLPILLLPLLAAPVLAHETRVVGGDDGERYTLVVGMLNEPVFTGHRTGLDLRIANAADDAPVEGLENALRVTLTAPGGEIRTLEVRPMHGEPGRYVDAYLLTVPGTYEIHVRGFVGAVEIDEVFPREVADGAELRFP